MNVWNFYFYQIDFSCVSRHTERKVFSLQNKISEKFNEKKLKTENVKRKQNFEIIFIEKQNIKICPTTTTFTVYSDVCWVYKYQMKEKNKGIFSIYTSNDEVF